MTSIGDVVLYVMPDGSERPAMVIALSPDNRADLQIFTNGLFDGTEANLSWKPNARYSEDEEADTWHKRIVLETTNKRDRAGQAALGPPVEHPRFKAMKDRAEGVVAAPAATKARVCPQHGIEDCPKCFD